MKKNIVIDGMHCQSCKTLIETEINNLEGVKNIKVDFKNSQAHIDFDENKISLGKIFKEINNLGYGIGSESKSAGKEITAGTKIGVYGIGIAVVLFMLSFIYLVGSFGGFELLARLNETDISYGVIFLIGLLSGFHCMGMCGGIVVAYSATSLKKAKKRTTLPHFYYNLGRVLSYTIIGGILGGLGSFFGINPGFTGTVLLIAGGMMILIGLSFITKWNWLEMIKIKTPGFIAKFLFGNKYSKKPKGPLVVGLLTGFMPCGPLQAMQLYALTTGSIFTGALSMAVYSLGTVPMIFGFGVFITFLGKKYIHKIIKVSGVVVLLLGFIMINRGLTSFGYGVKFSQNILAKSQVEDSVAESQTVNMEVGYFGYKPNVLYIKKGIPVKWVINVKKMTGCTNAIMIESLGIKRDLVLGENIINFTPPEGVKEIKFSCWMRMVWGKFIVLDDNADIKNNQSEANQEQPINAGASCGSEESSNLDGTTCSIE